MIKQVNVGDVLCAEADKHYRIVVTGVVRNVTTDNGAHLIRGKLIGKPKYSRLVVGEEYQFNPELWTECPEEA